MGALSSLLMLKPSDKSLQAAWVSSVLPLAADPEQTCQVTRSTVHDKKIAHPHEKAHPPRKVQHPVVIVLRVRVHPTHETALR